jgi:hypothetical protein
MTEEVLAWAIVGTAVVLGVIQIAAAVAIVCVTYADDAAFRKDWDA